MYQSGVKLYSKFCVHPYPKLNFHEKLRVVGFSIAGHNCALICQGEVLDQQQTQECPAGSDVEIVVIVINFHGTDV